MQNSMQERQLEAQQTLNAPQLYEQMQQQQAIVITETDPKKVIDGIMLRLRGVERKPDGTIVRVATPKMNQVGLEEVWFILESHINQNIILSHLKEQEIKNIIVALSDDLVDCLALNWRAYGITRKTDLDVINNCILVNIYLALKRAEGQNEKNFLSKISIENISGGQRLPQRKKESFWDKFRL